ncbi:VOC family protein [Leifsonia poae]|uniref:Glyoxalase n=2 Tax=Leifsonia poae TaxID=110933 RepID=A0A9W6H7N2_9MICO|nr:glyoxalase [Leifsonia poae]
MQAMIGTFESIIIDCPDPRALARFYSQLLGLEIVGYDEDWAEIVAEGGRRPLVAFQQVAEYNPPQWPSQSVPQQMHIDVRIDTDFDTAEAAVLALGATSAGSEHPTFRVYRDPAGHPFCLIKPND